MLSTLFVVGCASTGHVQQRLTAQMMAGDYPAAIEIVEAEKQRSYGGKNRLLYFLERGMLLHVVGRYAESNLAFEEAKRIGNDLYTESLSRTGLSLVSNDYALDYAGENFERTLIHLFSAMNYLKMYEPEAAQVEIRQVGDYLRKLQIDSSNENVYQEDAFARYLSALVYESNGEYDSALVDYKKALDAYGDYSSKFSVARPGSLFPNAGRVAGRLGQWAGDDLRDRGWDGSTRVIPADSGELVILHYNGLSPIKGQTRFTIPFAEAWLMVALIQVAADDASREDINRAIALASTISGVDLISVTFPKYVDRPYSIALMEPRVESAAQTTGPELVEDIGAIAKKDLEDRIVRIRAKAIARAAIKYAIQKGVAIAAERADDDRGRMLGLGTHVIGNIVRFASEQADKRVWSTLPDQIWMSSMILPAGTHDLEVDFWTAESVLVESREISNVEIEAGGRQFVILRTVK
ncbi:MAG: hypothetical protein CL933_03070 [Deltaproteobacteria bacterium]|nr:hypothetical protein [Deltaproteobacteria bacterium]